MAAASLNDALLSSPRGWARAPGARMVRGGPRRSSSVQRAPSSQFPAFDVTPGPAPRPLRPHVKAVRAIPCPYNPAPIKIAS